MFGFTIIKKDKYIKLLQDYSESLDLILNLQQSLITKDLALEQILTILKNENPELFYKYFQRTYKDNVVEFRRK